MKKLPFFLNSRGSLGFADIISGILVTGIIGTGAAVYYSSVYHQNIENQGRSQSNVFESAQRDIVTGGYNPNSLGAAQPLSGGAAISALAPSLSALTGANNTPQGGVTVSAISLPPTDTGHGGTLGFTIGRSGAAPNLPVNQLAAPTFSQNGSISASQFPLSGLVVPSNNPPGTVVRYTTNGTAPTASSPVWTSSVIFSLTTLPGAIEAQAFNANPAFTASSVATASFSINVTPGYSRTDGSSNSSFTYQDVTGASGDGIILSIGGSQFSGVNIYYTLDGTSPSTNGTLYSGTFFPAGSSFAGGSVPLRAIAVAPGSIASSTELDVTLTPSTQQLPAPTVALSPSSPPTTPATATVTLPYSWASFSGTLQSGATTTATSFQITAP
jgi:hypothetical protein